MSVEDRDDLTGHRTTGHERNGITELNTSVPRVIWWAIGITHVWALVVWILMPSWPLVTTYTKGLLGVNQKDLIQSEMQTGKRYREHWEAHLSIAALDDIRAEPALMEVVTVSAPQLWGDNCAICHGQTGAGGPGFPSLVDKAWLWGGSEEAVMETLRVGINADHPDTRMSEMLAFGALGLLTRDQIRQVAAYVQSLSELASPEPDIRAEGEQIYLDNCASCHGEDATGVTELGAPNLTDAFWIYGSDDAALFRTIHDGRQGWMPAWDGRLSEAQARIIALYLLDILPDEAE